MENQNQQAPSGGKNKKTLWIILAIVVIFVYIVYMFGKYGSDTGSPTPAQPVAQKEVSNNQQQEIKKEPDLSVVFDIPSLIGKSYAQLKTELGNPVKEYIPNDIQKKNANVSYDAIWNKYEVELSVSYFDANKPISYIFVSNSDDTGASNQEQLMKLCKLENAVNLKIIPQKAMVDKSKITGLHICNKDYKGETYIIGSENCK